MCTEYVHEQANKVVQSLYRIIKELQSSKRKCDKGFKDAFKIMIRKTFDVDGAVNYQLFIVQDEQVSLCAAAWEIIGTFEGLKEDLFFFIKGNMRELLRGPHPSAWINPRRINQSLKGAYG